MIAKVVAYIEEQMGVRMQPWQVAIVAKLLTDPEATLIQMRPLLWPTKAFMDLGQQMMPRDGGILDLGLDDDEQWKRPE